MSLSIATNFSTDISAQTTQTTIPASAVTYTETSVAATETQFDTVTVTTSPTISTTTETQFSTVTTTTTMSYPVPLARRVLTTIEPYCSNVLTSSVTITEVAPTPTHVVTADRNVTTSILGTASRTVSTTLTNSTTLHSTTTITQVISTTSTLISSYDSPPTTHTDTSLQTATTTVTTTNVVTAMPAPTFYIHVSGYYLYYDEVYGSVELARDSNPSEGLFTLDSDSKLMNAGRYIGLSSGSTVVTSTDASTALVCSINSTDFTCDSLNGSSVFLQCPYYNSLYYASSSSFSLCYHLTLQAVEVITATVTTTRVVTVAVLYDY